MTGPQNAASQGVRPILVGESNPYGDDPDYALYPAPDGCAGHRLCVKILGMHRIDYLNSFERVNLVEGEWSMREARKRMWRLTDDPSKRFVLLGSKVCSAFYKRFTPWIISGNKLILPHPSGLCRLWNLPGSIECTRKKVLEFVPELADKLGKV